MEETELLRAICLYVSALSKPEVESKPEQIIDRAEIFYQWVIKKDDE